MKKNLIVDCFADRMAGTLLRQERAYWESIKPKKKQKRSLIKSLSRLDVVKRMRSSMRGEGSAD